LTNETVTYETEASSRKAINSANRSLWARWINRKQLHNHVSFPKTKESRSVARLLKRTFDLTGAGIGTVLLFPLLAAIGVAIKLTSKGPVFFRQQRYGLNGTHFTVLKFRTMHTQLCDRSGIKQTVAQDPRVTWVGSFLRKSNFDELPQLFNVLKGEMSLVGPRPHVPGMLAAGMPYEEFDMRYMDRHQVRPGITGLAQVKGFRGETKDDYAARMRLELDLKYIETSSLLLDAKIVLRTIAYEFFSGNGY
jgi:polysaccharide biosynthesis protein PslA